MVAVRIIKRTKPGGNTKFVIQTKVLWRWWADAVVRHPVYGFRSYRFDTLEQAQRNLCYFDGSTIVEEIVETKE